MGAVRKSPAVAVLLSFVPGLGHVYVGQTVKGLVLFVTTGVLGFLMVVGATLQYAVPLLAVLTAPLYVVVVGPALVIYSMADSYRAAAAANARAEGASGAADESNGTTGNMPTEGDGARTAEDDGAGPPTPSPTPPGNGWSMDLPQATIWGLALTGVGLFLVLRAAFPGVIRFGLLWPLLILGFGLAVLWRALGRDMSGGMGQ